MCTLFMAYIYIYVRVCERERERERESGFMLYVIGVVDISLY